MLRLEGEAHADQLERVRAEDAGDAGEAAGEEAPDGRLVVGTVDDDGADLLVGEELDGGVGEDAQNGGGVAAVEAQGALVAVNVAHHCVDAVPAAGVSAEFGGGGLEEDFDAVERRDDRFCLRCIASVLEGLGLGRC